MAKIFAGVLFVCLNFNLNFNNGASGSLNLLPDFVGFILLYLGTQQLRQETERYHQAKPWLLGLAVYSGIVWVMNLMGRTGSWLAVVLSLVAAVATYYATWLVIKGFDDIEKKNSVGIAADECMRIWKICAILNIVAMAFSWVPVINILLVLGMVVVTIMLLVSINKTRKLYEGYTMLRHGSEHQGPEF